MVDRTNWKSLNLDVATMEQLSLMAKGLNMKKASLIRLLLTEMFDLFLLYKPFDVNIHFETSIFPLSQLTVTFSGKRNLIVGRTTEKRLNEALLRVEGQTVKESEKHD